MPDHTPATAAEPPGVVRRLARMTHDARNAFVIRWARDPDGMTLVVPYGMRADIARDPDLREWGNVWATGVALDDLTIRGVPVLWATNATEPRVLVDVEPQPLPAGPGEYVTVMLASEPARPWWLDRRRDALTEAGERAWREQEGESVEDFMAETERRRDALRRRLGEADGV